MAKRCAHQEPETSDAQRQPELYYRVHSLLHTVRSIGQHEDELCGLLNEIQSEGGASAMVDQELRALLDEIPSSEYQVQLDALYASLGEPKRAARGRASVKAVQPAKSKGKQAQRAGR